MEQELTVEKKGFAERFFGGDKVLWVIIAILAVMSLLVVYSSTASMAYRVRGGDTMHYFLNQLKFMTMGFLVMYVVHRINYQVYFRVAPWLFVISLAFMSLTFFIGVNLNSAQRWIAIPGVGLTFQPSDFLRVTLVMILAKQLAVRQIAINKLPLFPRYNPSKRKPANKEVFMDTTLPLLLPVALACGMIFFSNFSTSAITFITCYIMLYIGRVRVRELTRLMAIVLITIVVAVSVMSAADIGRARTWTNRIKDFAGVEQTDGRNNQDDLQVEQAKIAIASGGLIGKGPGNSTQRANLPHAYSDFAYAFIIEEYGLLMGFVVLMLYLWIFFRTIVIFRRCGTAFPSLLVLGLGLMIVLQAIINMLVSVNLIPVTGQTLPLISLGGSSMVFTALALGMILGVSRQVNEQTIDTPKGESLLEK